MVKRARDKRLIFLEMGRLGEFEQPTFLPTCIGVYISVEPYLKPNPSQTLYELKQNVMNSSQEWSNIPPKAPTEQNTAHKVTAT